MTQAPRMADDVAGAEGVAPDDAAIIAESRQMPDRFGAVFDRHAVAIHGYIARRLGPDAADDLVAEVFLVAFGKRADYDREQPSARPWLYGIATRLIGRHRRDEVRFFRAIAKTGVDPAAGRGDDPVADEGIRLADAHALRPRLALALASLSKSDRDALLLVTDGLRYEEAARALGIPPGTLSSRVAGARRKLQEALGAVGNADGTFVTKAWAVERNPDGTVTVTMDQQIQDPAGVQRALREDGIDAYVQVHVAVSGPQGGQQACSYAHLDKAPAAVQQAVITSNQIPVASNGVSQESWTIHPSAMPPGSSILFADWVSSAFSAVLNPSVLSTDVTPVCTAG